ncbi:MAG TPA: PKD domain-containing protein [Candidatus Limnocylindrales bacterium]|nr:PKD domain-containing protein [Candidatus Limnocylindrales bacterium]
MHRAYALLLRTSFVLALGAWGLLFTPVTASAASAAAPTITVPGPQSVDEGALLAFTVSATDPDGQPLFLRASGMPSGATFTDFHDNTGSFRWTPSMTQAGTYGVTFLADDTFGGVDSKGVSISVRNINQAPVLDPIGDQTVERGSSMSIFIMGSDPDDDALTMTQSGLPSYGSFTDFGGGAASLGLDPPANMAPGTTSMTVHLSDGTLTTSETFSITVYAVGSQYPPTLSSIGNQTVNEGSTANVSVSATDGDGETLSWSVSLPGLASFTPTGSGPGTATGTLTLAPGYCSSGTYSAGIGVSDGSSTTNENFTITVSDVNRLPAWAPPTGGYTLALNEGGAANLSVSASDPDQECGTAAPSLFYLSAGAPSSLTVTFADQGAGSGLLHVAAGYDAAGSYTLHLRARDAVNAALSADVSVSVTVSGVDRAPVASAGGPYAGYVGSRLAMSASGSSDPDGDALTYAWTFGDGATGSGVEVTHAYSAAGHFQVSMAAGDGTLSTTDTTGADVSNAFLARAFFGHGPLRLKTGKPREDAHLEAIGRSFELGAVILSSLRLSAPDGMGAVPFITPLTDGITVGEDTDHNGVPEISVDFAKDDLRSLFLNLEKRTPVTMVLSANLAGGGSVSATIGMEVEPERKLVARMMPNPLNPETTIRVNMETPDRLTIRLYDITGRVVRTVLEGVDMPAGVHDFRFDGRGSTGQTLPSGRYFYRAETAVERTSGSLTILK